MAKSFSQYYAEALANAPRATRASAPASSPVADPSAWAHRTGAATPVASTEGPTDPLGHLLDFLSRGTYGATNVATETVDDLLSAGRKASRGDVGGAIWDTVFNNPILGAISPAAGLIQATQGETPGQVFTKGLTTSDPAKKRFFSDVIEESTDKIGTATDPNYIDRVDNVAGPLKGIVGFAGDMLLDPLSYVPIPVGAIAKVGQGVARGARGAKGAVEALRGAKTVDETAEAAVKVADEVSTTPDVSTPPVPKVSPREAMTIPMPDAPKPAPVLNSEALAKVLEDAVSSPVAPTAAKIEDAVKVADETPLVDAAPVLAEIEKAAEYRPTPKDIQKAFADLSEPLVIPGVKGKVTPQQAQDIFLKVAAGARTGPRQKAIYEHVVRQIPAGKSELPPAPLPKEPAAPAAPGVAAPDTGAPSPALVAATPGLSPRDESLDIWANLVDSYSVGGTPLTREHLEQAISMEAAGTLPKEWERNLRFFREEASIERDFATNLDKMRSELPAPESKASEALFEAVSHEDDAAKWLAENDINPTPGAMTQATKIQGEADDLGARQAAARADAQIQAMTPEQIIASSGQAERMKNLLDTVEMLVKGGEIPAKGEISPVVPGTKGFGYSEQVISDYAASFDYWVANGLSDLADKSGKVEILRVRGDREWTEKVTVSDVQSWLKAVNDVEGYRPVNGTYGPDISAEDYDRLLAVDALFREEIAADMVMNPAKEAVEITNVIDAWQYLIKEKNDFLQTQMGEAGYRYILSQMNGNAATVAQRMQTLRTMLEPGFGLNDLKTLKRTARLNETRPILGMLGEEIPALGTRIEQMLHPAVEQAIDPIPTKVPVKEVPEPDPDEASIVAQPSTITPTPSTPDEVQAVIETLNKPSKPQKGKLVESARVEVSDDASLSDIYDVAAGELLASVIGRDIHDIPKVAPHKTSRTRARRTHETPGEGFGWHLKKYNTQNQYTLEAAVFKKAEEISERVFEIQSKGAENLSKTFSMNRARAFESMYLELRSRVDRALNKVGVKQVIGQAEGLVPLSYFDIFTSLSKNLSQSLSGTDMGEYVRLLLFSNGQTRVAPTNLMDAVQVAVWGGSRDDVFETLMNTKGPQGRDIPNNFAKGQRNGFHLTLGEGHRGKHVRGSLEEIFPGIKFPTTKGSMQWLKIPGDELAEVLTNAVMRSVDELAEKATNNGWRMEERGLTEVYDMSSKVLKRLDDLYMNPGKMADFMRGVERISDDVAEDATSTGAYTESADAASDLVRNTLGDDIVDDAEHLVEVDSGIGKTSLVENVNRSTNERFTSSAKRLDDEIDADRATKMLEGNVMTKIDSDDPVVAVEGLREEAEILDYGGKYTEEVQEGVRRFLGPWAQRLDVSHGHKRVWSTTHNKALAAHEILNSFRIRLLHLSKKYDKPAIADAWQKVQMNVPVKEGDVLHEEMRAIISALWNPDQDNLFTNAFLSTEGSLDYVNRIITEKFRNYSGPTLQFDVGAAKARSIEEVTVPDMWPNYLAEQWRDLKVDDPLDFIQRMSDAAVTVAERRAVVESFLHNGRKWGAISTTPKPGFVRLNATGAEHTSFGVFLAQAVNKKQYPNGLFIEKELAQELRHADYLTTVSRQMSGELGEALRKHYMPILDAWKLGMTIYRPGHHVRNMIGDTSLTWVKRGNRYFSKSGRDALRVMSMRNDYTDIDMMRSLRALEGLDAMPPKQGDVIVRGSLNGKEVELTAGQIMSLLHTKGLRPTFHMGEGLYEDAILASKTAKVARTLSLQDTKINEVAGDISQYRDHTSRAHHFLQILNQELSSGGPFSGKQFKGISNLEDLFDRAAAEVKKYHPDASMLTPWESKVARPIIPFYSWFAKVLPAIAESTLRNPGRVIAFPKASYELAVSMGVNPDTIYDPFPDDQLFPSFLTEKALGPQFQFGEEYFGINPGISHLDVFNTLGPDPIRGILGMTSPLFRVPAEIASGGSWGTGARINDASDYVDSALPGVNHLANFTGISPSGTLASLLSGTPELDQQYQVMRGNKGGAGSEDTWMALMNWATGIGAQNMSRSNYINFAEFEQKRGEVPTK